MLTHGDEDCKGFVLWFDRFLFEKSSPEYLYYDAKVKEFRDVFDKQDSGLQGVV